MDPNEQVPQASEDVDEFEQLEDVNGDVVDFNPNDWKLVGDDEPLVEDIDDDDEGAGAAASEAAAAGDAAEEGEEDDQETKSEPIVVTHDASTKTLDGHGHEPVYSLAINPKFPNLAISGGGDDNAVLWDVVTGKQKFHLTGHTDSITSVEFSKNGMWGIVSVDRVSLVLHPNHKWLLTGYRPATDLQLTAH